MDCQWQTFDLQKYSWHWECPADGRLLKESIFLMFSEYRHKVHSFCLKARASDGKADRQNSAHHMVETDRLQGKDQSL